MRAFVRDHGWTLPFVASYRDWIFGPRSVVHDALNDLPPARTQDGAEVRIDPNTAIVRPVEDQTPDTCRIGSETYAYELWARVSVRGVLKPEPALLGRFPRMVEPHESPGGALDAGYFIVDGTERAFVNAEGMRLGAPRFERSGTRNVEADLSSLDARLVLTLDVGQLAIRVALGFKSNRVEASLDTLLRALGWDGALPSGPLGEYMFIEDGNDETDAETELGRAALRGTGAGAKRARAAGAEILDDRVLPFLPSRADKIEFLLWAARELVAIHVGERDVSDAHALQNRRIDTAGFQVARLMRSGLKDMWTRASRRIGDSLATDRNLERAIDADILCAYAARSMMSAEENVRGAAVLPRRASWLEAVSLVRRVVTTSAAAAHRPEPRMPHGSWYGFYCAAETQEGDKTGLARETAVFAVVSPIGDSKAMRAAVAGLDMGKGDCDVYVDHARVARDVDFDKALAACRELKRTADPRASVTFSSKRVDVDTSEGRPQRPVWIGAPEPDFDGPFADLVARGKVEWVDAAECAQRIIATKPGAGPCSELDACALFGASAACVPFADHNPGSRNLFAAHVRHQAIGEPHPFSPRMPARGPLAHEFDARFDAEESYSLWYAQRALCDTRLAREIRAHEHPCGWNAVVFILAHPYGQEDAVGVARRHVELGGAEVDSRVSVRRVVDESKGERFGCIQTYPKVDTDGLPRVGDTVFPTDVFMVARDDTKETFAMRWRQKQPARVEAVVRTRGGGAAVRFVWRRTLEVGDKFATRHGQKGVAAWIFDDDDSWVADDGVTPDLVMSPAAFPTRMTYGHLLEMLCATANSLEPPPRFAERGCEGASTECTPYVANYDYAKVQELLRARGFQPRGHRKVFSTRTGDMLDCDVFVGPAFVQRVTHLARPKCYARGRGARNPQTGQPPKGRRVGGGNRMGEGEVKAVQAHGAASTAHTVLVRGSDGLEVRLCSVCHEVSGDVRCRVCGNAPTAENTMTRAFLVVRDQLRAAHIDPRLE